MPEMSVVGVPWRNSQLGTSYPFAATASLSDTSGLRQIPADLFIDASLYPAGGQDGLRLAQVSVQVDRIVLVLGDNANDAIASGEFLFGDTAGYLSFLDTAGRDAGMAVINPELMGSLVSWGTGDYFFTQSQTEWAARCVTPLPATGVEGILLDDGSLLTGDIWLVGEAGVMLAVEEVNRPATCLDPAEIGTRIKVHVVGDPLFQRRLCEDSAGFQAYPTSPAVLGIRVVQAGSTFVVTPDDFGRVYIGSGSAVVGDSILRVRTSSQGLVVGAVGNR